MIIYPFFVVKGKLTHEKENFSYRDRSTRSYSDQGTIEAQHACRVIKESPAKRIGSLERRRKFRNPPKHLIIPSISPFLKDLTSNRD